MGASKRVVIGAAVGLVVAVVGVSRTMNRARADGVPTTEPLVYSGYLEESGAPVSGTRNVRLQVWDSATSTASANLRCITTAPNVTLTAGTFRVPLDASCTAVVRATPDLWIEVEVAGTSFGREPIRAVPFALEAGRAADLTPAARASVNPPGTIVAFAGTTAPAGWLLCNGAAVGRTANRALFDAIGTAYGAGDGTSTFNLPDFRGRFLRGTDLGTGRDPDRATRAASATGGNAGDAVGSLQSGQYASHAHSVTINAANATHSHSGQTSSTDPGIAQALANSANGYFSQPGYTAHTFNGAGHSHSFTTNSADANHAHTGTVGTAGGSETRPVNVNVNWIIKL